jgi:hypothetical protein
MPRCRPVLLALLAAVLLPLAAQAAPLPDTPYPQAVADVRVFPEALGTISPTALALTPGRIWMGAEEGLFVLDRASGVWQAYPGEGTMGPVFDVAPDGDQVVVAAWDGVYRIQADKAPEQIFAGGPVAALNKEGKHWRGYGPNGLWREGKKRLAPLPCAGSVREALFDGERPWVATAMGLSALGDTPALYQNGDEIISSDVHAVAQDAQGRIWAGGLGGITIYENGQRVQHLTPAEGLPSVNVRALALGADGAMWIGTTVGLARYDGTHWSFRHSRRWLADDEVRDLSIDANGDVVVLTARGISILGQKTMTLAEKSAYFLDVIQKRHIRPPFIVEKCRLETPGDLSVWHPEDDDNDGSYTAMFGIAEAFRYAVTQDPQAKAHADKAFEFLELLQRVTETDGFVARTVVPADWTQMHDMNETLSPQERAKQLAGDPRYKPVEIRWRPSADGQWLWKGDTSSDETTGHFWAYGLYHDLAADAATKPRVVELARRQMNHIMENGYLFVDPIDGQHTRWGVWAPERLNHDPLWRAERGINSLEILSYLKTTYHLTGDEKYQTAYLDLLHNHHYLENIKDAKTYATSWVTHIDTELLTMAYVALLRYETDPTLKQAYLESLDLWFRDVQHEQNPFADFTYMLLTGTLPGVETSIGVLREIPLDLVNWTVDQSAREDIRRVRTPILEDWNMDRLVPVSERPVIRWDKNMWAMAGGDGGQTEWCPTFWLLPYWMARHLNAVE